VKGHYRDVTLSVEDRHWWYRGRREIIGALMDQAELRPSRILDAGCGGGGNLSLLTSYGSVTGLEPSAEAASRARSRDLGLIVEGTLEKLPFEEDSFDLAVALDVIEHLDDDVRGLAELKRVIAPGGHLLVTVPAYPRLWSYHDVVNGHRRRYIRRTLVSAALAAGWTPLRTTYFNLLLLPLAAGRRLLYRPGRREPQISDFERTPPTLDRPLQLLMRFEARVIRAGVALPAGLSLLGLFEHRPGSPGP
jgi:SAM-dependent methyltransferase